MTVPGVYTSDQIQAHVDSVIASDGRGDEERVEVMARAIYASYQYVKPWEHPDTVRIHHRHTRDAARAALNALRQMEGE